MSTELLGPEHSKSDEVIQGIEAAVMAIANIRTLLAQKRDHLELELKHGASEADNIIQQIKRRIRELEDELGDHLAFLREFDPKLYAELKKQ